MGYSFCLGDKTTDAALRRIARDLIVGAIRGFDDPVLPLPLRIHVARKSVKKLRGMIRLVRPVFADYSCENEALRAAGMTVAPLRNATVLLWLFDDLARTAKLDPALAAALREPLLAHTQLAEDPTALAARVAGFIAAMRKIEVRAAKWKIRRTGFAALAEGLEKTLTDAKKAMRRAEQNQGTKLEAEAVHTLRKRIKDHWYQCRLLAPIWPHIMAPRITAADTLGVALGDHHDLSELLSALPDAPGRAKLADAATARQAALWAQALPIGHRLLATPPETLAAEWRGWWEVWQSERR